MEQTVIIFKPDAVERELVSKLIEEFHSYKVDFMLQTSITQRQAENFYAEHQDKKFFNRLVRFMCSGPAIFCIFTGDNVIKEGRNIIKKIRAEYADKEHTERNVIHGSDSQQSAEREIGFILRELKIG